MDCIIYTGPRPSTLTFGYGSMCPVRVKEPLNDVLEGVPTLLHMVLKPASPKTLQPRRQPKPSKITVEFCLCLNMCPTYNKDQD